MARLPNTQIINSIRSDLQNGRFDNMSFLPSERQYAIELGVGRGVVHNALKALQNEGLLKIVPRHGYSVVRPKALKKKDRRLRRILVRSPKLDRKSAEATEILSGICTAAEKRFAEVTLSFSSDVPPLHELIERISADEFQGVIYLEMTSFDRETFASLNYAGIPCVVANLESTIKTASNSMDFRGIGRIAGLRLLESGHRKIGILSGNLEQDNAIYAGMLAGLRGALAEEEIEINKNWIIDIERNNPDCIENVKKLLSASDCPTAFFAMRDHRAEVLFHAAAKLGLKIPQDISVIGYDNISWSEAEEHGLTTISQPVEKIGVSAVEMLENWYVSGTRPKNIKIHGSLIERSSILDVEEV